MAVTFPVAGARVNRAWGVADADAIEDLLTAYEREGAHFVALPAALADPFFAQDPGQPAPFGPAFPYLLAKPRGVAAPPPIYARDLGARLAALCPNQPSSTAP